MKKQFMYLCVVVATCLSCSKLEDMRPHQSVKSLSVWKSYADLHINPNTDKCFPYLAAEEWMQVGYDASLSQGNLDDATRQALLDQRTNLLAQVPTGSVLWCASWCELLSIFDTVSYEGVYKPSSSLYPAMFDQVKKLPDSDTSRMLRWRLLMLAWEDAPALAQQNLDMVDTTWVLSHDLVYQYHDTVGLRNPLLEFVLAGNTLEYAGIPQEMAQGYYGYPLFSRDELLVYKQELQHRLSANAADTTQWGVSLLGGLHGVERWAFMRRNGLAHAYPTKLTLPNSEVK